MKTDRFGNRHAPSLAYARGRILATTEDDFRKLRHAWSLIRAHDPETFARAIDAALTRLGALLRTPDQLTTLLFGDTREETSCSIS